MRPIVYNGVDLSGVCSAEVIEKVALPVEAETLAVPRRAGALLVAGAAVHGHPPAPSGRCSATGTTQRRCHVAQVAEEGCSQWPAASAPRCHPVTGGFARSRYIRLVPAFPGHIPSYTR